MSFTYRTVDFSTYGVTVVGASHQRMPQPRVNVSEFAQASGGVTQGASFGFRQIRLSCMLVAASQAAKETAINNVVAQLVKSQTVGAADLEVVCLTGKLFKNARLVSAMDVELSTAAESFDLEFLADPFPVASSSTNAAPAATDGVAEAIAVAGIGAVPAEWVVKNTSGGQATSVVLDNDKAAGSVIWANPLEDGEWLKLKSDTQTAEVSSDSGSSWSAVPANKTGTIPEAFGGETNNITVTGLDSTIDLTYTEGQA